MTLTQEEEWIKRLENDQANIVYGIEELVGGTLIGSIGLHRIENIHQIASTGTIIHPITYRGGGYGTDAKMLLLDRAFNWLNLRKVCASVYGNNPRSLAYMLRTGYREEGRRVRQIFKDGQFVDEILTGCFREDWLPIWEKYRETGEIR